MTTPGDDGLTVEWSARIAFQEAHDSLTDSRTPGHTAADAQTHVLRAIAYALLGIGIQGNDLP